jgi:hypothetical protein
MLHIVCPTHHRYFDKGRFVLVPSRAQRELWLEHEHQDFSMREESLARGGPDPGRSFPNVSTRRITKSALLKWPVSCSSASLNTSLSILDRFVSSYTTQHPTIPISLSSTPPIIVFVLFFISMHPTSLLWSRHSPACQV